MHEAQNPYNGANIKNLNSVDSPQPSERTTNPFYSILAGERKVKELLLLAPGAEEPLSNQTVDCSEEEDATEYIDTEAEVIIDSQSNQPPQFDEEDEEVADFDNSLKDDWVAEPNIQQQAIINTEFEKLLRLNEELRSANDKLYEQAEQLTTALSDSEAALQRQYKRSTVAESMLKQQTQELNAAQAQIQFLFEQLENSQQNLQRQEGLAESYKVHLEANQQRLAQLERECALIQNKYSEQTWLLSQSENACRELRTRLKRQQRQTLQFKAALEKSLETSIPGYEEVDDSDSNFLGIRNNSSLNKSKESQAISSMQSIKPWSANEEYNYSKNDLWEQEIVSSGTNGGDSSIHEESSTWEFTANPNITSVENTNDTANEGLVSDDLANDDSFTDSTNINQVVRSSDSAREESNLNQLDQEVAPSDSSELEDQLDSVIQTFFASQTESVAPEPAKQEDVQADEEITPTWTTIIEPRGQNDGNDNNVVNADYWENSSTDNEPLVSFTSSIDDISNDETQDYWEEVSHFPAFDLSENAPPFDIVSDTENEHNSPSPIIYPKRPPKGRKSLASVELPKFPQKKDDNQ
ncbi:hypothetical protein Riv7116_2352 [Rivularia sp. PCC 7116]|uniref:hypothetical protein n=1 Tax=Rivularia sp. PCC 7116 TaxID=373994 RepID=UPI00029F248F|nr:hypothetical protein [Rivularia sp. PCC 7116]AFY54868.1 hypothetical protein Riv7116_2352 [Rivularia sp. PCC 7116]